MRPTRPLLALALGGALCAASVGLVLAQEPAPPTEPAGAAAGPTVALGGDAPPPEEAVPPPAVGNTEAEPLPGPDDNARKTEPLKRPRFTSAILQAVDKTTAETLRFEAKVGEPIRYRGLVLTVHACEGTAPDEGYADSVAHLDIQTQPEGSPAARVIYRGWMFASSPGLHAVEHPLYDVWLIACKTAAPPAPGVKL